MAVADVLESRVSAYDVIALGETMLSLVAEGGIGSAEILHVTHGGAESNVCVGLARSGLRTAWVSRLGADPPGDRIASDLRREGVDLRWVRRDPVRPTGLMLRETSGAVVYHRAGSAASALSPADLEDLPVGEARAVLVSGVTALIGPEAHAAALELLEAARGLRVVDPNLRAGLWGSGRQRELVLPLVERADLLLGGEAELATLVGDHRGEPLARRCRELGPSEVVVKRGREGAGVLDGSGAWHEHRPEPVDDVDPVGAGDAFDAGYLAARLRGAPELQALAEGAWCGAAVASSLGDTAGFPRGRSGRAGGREGEPSRDGSMPHGSVPR